MLGLHKRLSLNFAANIYAQFVAVAYQLLMVPLFLTFWPKELYGEWLVLSALPGYIALSNLGLMNVAGNHMTIALGAGDVQKARESLHTVWGAQLGLNVAVGILLVVLLSVVDIASVFKLSHISSASASLTLLIMSLYAMLNLQAGVFGGIYRAVGQNARGVFVGNTIRLLSVIAMAGALFLRVKDPVWLAATTAASYTLGALFLFWDTVRVAPELRPGLKYFKWNLLKTDLKLGIAFMAYPLGRAFTNQGMLLFVNAFLNSSAVVTLSTLRTVVNTVFQLSNLISLSTWPEFSRLYGEKNKVAVKKLFCFSTALGIWTGVLGSLVLCMIGPSLLSWWTRGAVMVDRPLLILFLIPVVLNSGWYTSSTVLNATNRHQRIALCFLVASVLVPVATWIIQRIIGMGLYAIGCGFICMDVVMLIYVFPQALQLIEVSRREWWHSFITFPKQVALIVYGRLNLWSKIG